MATLLEYKCPCCGGALSFDSEAQKMKCPYCDTEFETQTLKEMDEVLQETSAQDSMEWETQDKTAWEEPVNHYVCRSCGGELVTDENTAATSCPYCGNPVVLSGRLSGALKPELVIPFQLDKKAAMEAFKKHLLKKPLLPKVFKDENKIQEIQGMYVPFWLFDGKADARLRFRGTRVRTWSDSDHIHTETSHYAILREGDLSFADVPVDGSTKMPNDLMESIEPFDWKQGVDFQTAYLAGYLADKYDQDAEKCAPRANERIKNSTQEAFRETVKGYNTVVPEQSSIHVEKGHVAYALLPVWTMTTRFRDETYLFAMNGQTGKFVGNLPIDPGRFAAFFAGIAGGVAALCYVLGLLTGLI